MKRPTLWVYASEGGDVIVRRYLAAAIVVDGVRYEVPSPLAWDDSRAEVICRQRMAETRRLCREFWVRCGR